MGRAETPHAAEGRASMDRLSSLGDSGGEAAARHTPAPVSSSSGTPLRVAYLVNQYPKVSHSFIRREILAVERQGIPVERFAIRGWDGEVVDEEDITERMRTRYVLKGGVAPVLAALARSAVRRPRALFSAAREAVRLSRGSERPLPYHLMYLAEACWLIEAFDALGISHVHAHFGTNSAEVAMLAHVLGGPPYSFTVHGPDEFDNGTRLHLDSKIGRAKFVAAVNSYCRAQLFRRSRTEDWGKIKLVHCGLEEDFYRTAEAGLPAGRRFVCVGRLCEQKGQLILLEAFSRLLRSAGDCHLVLAGDGEMRAEIEERISALGLAGSATITGWISSDDVRREILAARALVLPSFQESLPVVIMEAMALRRPVITTYVAGIPELVRDGDTGWLVPAGSVGSLADAMAACLAASPETLGEMGDAARERVIGRHAVDAEAAKLAELFRQDAIRDEIEEWQS